MNTIVVCIPTYKRPEPLKKLIQSLFNTYTDRSFVKDLILLVVDNDAERSAYPAVEEMIKKNNTQHKLCYHNYPVKGLSNVRNELFTKAIELNADYIAGVDDDEYVTEKWLYFLVATLESNKGDIVLGPVRPKFSGKVPISISFWFRGPVIADNTSISHFSSNNFIITANFIKQNNMLFDKRFNLSGAEDTYFGITATKKNASIFWSSEALCFEDIPPSRASVNWLSKRKFRIANTYTYILILEKKYGLLLKKFFTSFFYVFTGILGLILLPFEFKYQYIGLLKLSEAFGSFSALLNIKFHEYK